MMKDHSQCNEGFTLVEMSIVLVIIGLVIGGIIVGKDLIESATIRSQLSQIEKLKAAANAFKLKFGSLPGDISFANANAFGIGVSSGNENGFIDGPNSGVLESYYFFNQLQRVGLFSCNNSNCNTSWDYVTMSQYDAIFVPSVINSSGILQVYGGPVPPGFGLTTVLTKNYIEICPSAALASTARPVSPFQAFAMDIKIDDGLPLTGVVIAMGKCYQGGHPDWWNTVQHLSPLSGAAGTANCVSTSTTPSSYNTQNASLTCGIRFEAGF